MSNSSLVNYTKISPNRTSPRRGKISKIVIHHMAGNLSVETCGNVFAPKSRQASSHYGIGSDGRIGMYCPESDRAWTTGHQIDHKAVTIEVADDVIGGNWHSSAKAMESLVKLCADICKRNGIKNPTYTGNGNGTFLMHKWYQATDCPGNYLESQFPWIAQQVNNLLNNSSYTAPSGSTVTVNPESKGYLMKGDTGSAVKTMQKMLIACGYSCGSSGVDGSFGNDTLSAVKAYQKANGLEVDGFYGSKTKASLTAKYSALKNNKPSTSTVKPNTSKPKVSVNGVWDKALTKRLQEIFKEKGYSITVDGIISNQWACYKSKNKGLTTGWEWKEKPNGKGSQLIKAMQKWAGMTGNNVDGEIGEKTIRAFQKKLGTVQDGYVSNPSNMVKALQTWANKQ